MENMNALQLFFNDLDRSFFMDINKDSARFDCAVPIGYGQTISQPSLVLFMTQKLNLKKHHKILEIGTGTGYQTAFLAEFGREVYTIERIEPLQKRASDKLTQLGYSNIHFIVDDGTYGLEDYAPFDRIIVTAAARDIPDAYLEQLAPDGILIIPVGDSAFQDLLMVVKDTEGTIHKYTLEAVRFVPLVGDYEI